VLRAVAKLAHLATIVAENVFLPWNSHTASACLHSPAIASRGWRLPSVRRGLLLMAVLLAGLAGPLGDTCRPANRCLNPSGRNNPRLTQNDPPVFP
jgi:hypothetical protein